MSPRPSRRSAPFMSRMVRESVLEATWKPMRDGKFALMTPVITFTEGRWVARMMWIPTALDFWARLISEVSTSGRGGDHQVGELVDDDDDVGKGPGPVVR